MRLDERFRGSGVVVRLVTRIFHCLDVRKVQLEMFEEGRRPRKFTGELLRCKGMNMLFAAERALGILQISHIPFLPEPVGAPHGGHNPVFLRSEEHTSELQSLMRISY